MDLEANFNFPIHYQSYKYIQIEWNFILEMFKEIYYVFWRV